MHEEERTLTYQSSFLSQAYRQRLVMSSLSGKVLELVDQTSNPAQVYSFQSAMVSTHWGIGVSNLAHLSM